MSDTSFEITNNASEMQFEILLDTEKAFLTYRFYKKSIAFMHTVVPKAHEGKGIASALAKAAFQYAEAHQKPVMVYCPFVSSFLKRHTEYRKQLDLTYHRP
jgi:predicted GNAT family acetyltransferase